MVKLRPFSKSDWMGFAGAEEFEDGSEPLIGEIRVADDWPENLESMDGGVVVVVDANGIEVVGEAGWYGYKVADDASKEDLLHIVNQLKEPLTTDQLEDLGFIPEFQDMQDEAIDKVVDQLLNQ